MLTPIPIAVTNNEKDLDYTVLNNIKIIAVTDSDGDELHVCDRYPNALPASILLPPYEAVSAEIDDQYLDAERIYVSYLMGREPDTFLSAIFAAMIKGVKLVFYIPSDGFRMKFVHTLLNYIFNVFGIQIQTTEIPFAYNPVFDVFNLCKLYSYNIISMEDLFLMYPDGASLEMSILNQLIFEAGNPYTVNNTIEEYLEFFNDFKDNVKKAGRMLIIPIRRRD